MEDIITLFNVNQGKHVNVLVSTGKEVSGEVESIQENYVEIKSGNFLFCVFYRHIIYVRLG